MTAPRYRRSSVRGFLESATHDHAAAGAVHDALWAALWNRRHEDIAEPVWAPDAAYAGLVAFAAPLGADASVTGIDTGDAFVAFKNVVDVPPVGSRVRLLPTGRDQWRIADGAQLLGLGMQLRFDQHAELFDTAWIEVLRRGLDALREQLEAGRDALAHRRAALGALSEPQALEDRWREEVEAIRDRVLVETEYTPAEAASLAKARAKGPRFAEAEELRVLAARKTRFQQRYNDEVTAFRDGAWVPIKETVTAALRKYAEFRTEVVRLEDALHRSRLSSERTMKSMRLLDALQKAPIAVTGMTFDPAQLAHEPRLGDELLRTIELLHGAIPQRAYLTAASFSGYRSPTAGPSVIPPRL